MHWKKDQDYLVKAIPAYRESIERKELPEAKRLTMTFAENLHQNTEQLQQRTIEAINQRLPYLDNLLAGALEKENYAQKYQHLYNSNPRPNGSREFNKCNTRHSYNGFLR